MFDRTVAVGVGTLAAAMAGRGQDKSTYEFRAQDSAQFATLSNEQ